MKKVKALLLVLIVMFLVGCERYTVEPGTAGVVIDRPWVLGTGGIRETTKPEGTEWYWMSTEVALVDIRPYQLEENFDDMMTADNIPVDFNVYLTIRILQPVKLVKDFSLEFYSRNVREPLRADVRDYCKAYPMTDLITSTSITSELESKIKDSVTKTTQNQGIPIEIIRITVGKIAPNQGVMEAINETATQQQRKKTELEKALAETNRKEAETNRAIADKAYASGLGLSPEQFVRLEHIKALKEIAARGNNTFIVGNIDGTVVPIK